MNGLLFFAVTWAVFSPPGASAEDESRYSVEEVTARLQEWQAKIATLRVHAQTVCDPHAKWAIDGGLDGVERIAYDDWIWTNAERVRHHNWVTFDGRPTTMRSLRVDSSAGSWTARYENSPDGITPTGANVTSSRGLHSPAGPKALYGLWLDGENGGWLGSVIERRDMELVGVADLDGRLYVHIRSRGPHPRDFWLDPEHGFLPVRVEWPRSTKFVVDEFFEPEPGFFFPKRGQFLHRHDEEVLQAEDWEVTAVELNRPIPAALWQPPATITKELGSSEKGELAMNEARTWARNYAVRMTTLDFWLERGFLVVAILFLAAVMLVWSRKHKAADNTPAR